MVFCYGSLSCLRQSTYLISLRKGLAPFAIKGRIVNILGFVGHRVFHNYSTLSLWGKGSHREYIRKWIWLCFSETLFTKTDSGPCLVIGYSALALTLINHKNKVDIFIFFLKADFQLVLNNHKMKTINFVFHFFLNFQCIISISNYRGTVRQQAHGLMLIFMAKLYTFWSPHFLFLLSQWKFSLQCIFFFF